MTGPLLTQPRPAPDASQSDDRGAHWLAAMHRGDWAGAWEVNDAVLASRDPATRDDPGRPYHERWVWDGRPLTGRALVRCYHGLGDTLQFWRYVAPLSAQADVVVEVQPALVSLLSGTVPLLPFDPAHPAPPRHDVEIMELAHALRLPPSPAPYLQARAMPLNLPRPIIGVCWAAWGLDATRSVPWPLLTPLGQVGSVVSLQRGVAGGPWPDPLDGCMDVTATARLIMACDHVVTIDTMVAHLAGALGRPVSVLLKADADWRWMRSRDDSPWYASARLYRQPVPGDWATPVALLLNDIAVGTPPSAPGS